MYEVEANTFLPVRNNVTFVLDLEVLDYLGQPKDFTGHEIRTEWRQNDRPVLATSLTDDIVVYDPDTAQDILTLDGPGISVTANKVTVEIPVEAVERVRRGRYDYDVIAIRTADDFTFRLAGGTLDLRRGVTRNA